MDAAEPVHILVVANRTAKAPVLLQEVERRAREEPCRFSLLIPDMTDRRRADWTAETARPLLERAARGPVDVLVGGPDPFAAVKDAVEAGSFDEIIVSTLPRKVSAWLRRDLVSRIHGLGLPVTAIIPGEARPSMEAVAGDIMSFERRAFTGARRDPGEPGTGDEAPRYR
jgi:hypothetical protein